MTPSQARDHFNYMLLQNVILYYVKDKLNILCICGTCKVWVYVSTPLWKTVDEHLSNELSGLHVVALCT